MILCSLSSLSFLLEFEKCWRCNVRGTIVVGKQSFEVPFVLMSHVFGLRRIVFSWSQFTRSESNVLIYR